LITIKGSAHRMEEGVDWKGRANVNKSDAGEEKAKQENVDVR